MKISILNADLSNNCLGRTYLLAKILQRKYEVEIVGPMFGDEIWKPVEWDKSITYKSIRFRGILRPYFQLPKLINMISGDVIYANKNLLSSFGVALLSKMIKKKPLVLDIDDWQMGFVNNNLQNKSLLGRFIYILKSTVRLYGLNSFWNNYICEKLSHYVTDITVSNNFLKKKFGGVIITHGRDTNYFNPDNFDKKKIREKYNIDDNKKVIMFSGSPRGHKGLESLVDVVSNINNKNIILFIVGLDDKDVYCRNLISYAEKKIGKGFMWVGMQEFQKIPEFLCMADLIVIPQKKTIATLGQLPAKVFDAMAMARPIIATNINDLSEILEGCGMVVENDDLKQLKESIEYIINNTTKAKEMGSMARKKCISKYNWDVMEKELMRVFDKYDNKKCS